METARDTSDPNGEAPSPVRPGSFQRSSPASMEFEEGEPPSHRCRHFRKKQSRSATTSHMRCVLIQLSRSASTLMCPGSTSPVPMASIFDAESLRYLSLDYAADVIRRWKWPQTSYESHSDHAEDLPVQKKHDVLSDVALSYEGSCMERCLGYPPDIVDSSLQWWEDRIHSEDRPRVMSSLRRFLESPSSRYWSESYRFLAYQPALPLQSSSFFSQPHNRKAYYSSSSISSTASSAREQSHSHSPSLPSAQRVQHHSHRHPDDKYPEKHLTVLDQIFLTRNPKTGRPVSAIGVLFSPEQRVNLAESLQSPRSTLMRSIPKAGISFIGSETIHTILENTTSGLFMYVSISLLILQNILYEQLCFS